MFWHQIPYSILFLHCLHLLYCWKHLCFLPFVLILMNKLKWELKRLPEMGWAGAMLRVLELWECFFFLLGYLFWFLSAGCSSFVEYLLQRRLCAGSIHMDNFANSIAFNESVRPIFSNLKTEMQRGDVVCLRSNTSKWQSQNEKPGLSAIKTSALSTDTQMFSEYLRSCVVLCLGHNGGPSDQWHVLCSLAMWIFREM